MVQYSLALDPGVIDKLLDPRQLRLRLEINMPSLATGQLMSLATRVTISRGAPISRHVCGCVVCDDRSGVFRGGLGQVSPLTNMGTEKQQWLYSSVPSKPGKTLACQ